MRIVVHGQQAFGKAVLERLLERGENVVAVFCAPDKEGRPRDPLAAFAEEKGLPVHQPKSWKTPEALELMRSYEPDLCVMAYVTLFVPQAVLDVPKLGTIQYHPSLLPLHRGPSSINWPIAMGETRTGLTIFWPDEGLDEGPILLQKEVEIGPDETLGDVYFKKLFPLGVDAMMEAVDLVRAGKAPKIPQDHSKATYESWFKKELAEIDWSKPVSEVYNLIRATNPSPGAWSTIKGTKLDIFDSAKLDGSGTPGEIVAITGEGIQVAAKGGRILIKRVRPPGGQKIPATEYAVSAGLKVGDRFDPPSPKSAAEPKKGSGGSSAAVKSDIEIAREAKMKPIQEVGAKLGIPPEALLLYGPTKAKVSFDFINTLKDRPDGKLILVTAITPTPAGEGKTTTTVGLGDALNRIGKKAMSCLREPSLGPCFGMKGGAAGGGYAQVVPMEDINLHFTGDFHAISSANNLLAAMIDNHIYWGNELGIDPRRIAWRRVMDMNDRALRSIVNSLGGVANGFPRQDGFDITVASEVMAILCLATDHKDLQRRLGNIVVAYTRDRKPIYARDLKADGAMTVLLKDALMPNLVQTLENNPVFVHGGPFANIAHGCNSVLATRTALKLADYVVTEAGFGADLGAEKFFDIKCRKTGLKPSAAVIVATVRALKMHGGVAKDDLKTENVEAVRKGGENLKRHIENVRKFGVPPVVAINRFISDTDAELKAVMEIAESAGTRAFACTHWADGGKGAEDLARHVVEICESGKAEFKFLYPDDMPLWDKIKTVATSLYGAADISADASVRNQLKEFEDNGYGHLPICMAKTQYSFSTNPNLRGAPTGHVVNVREVILSAGAEFVVAVCGDIMRMPGLPRVPAAEQIRLNEQGQIEGLF
nr:MAG: formate--tetrahydrofolate ligase [Pseudomonadota bacterium]